MLAASKRPNMRQGTIFAASTRPKDSRGLNTYYPLPLSCGLGLAVYIGFMDGLESVFNRL